MSEEKIATASSRTRHTNRRAQEFLLIWLDATIDEAKDKNSIKVISKLKEVINTLHTFTDENKCIKFIDTIDEGKTFLIISGALGQTTVPLIHDKPQIVAIYIYCGNKSRHEQWTQKWSKIGGVFTEIKPICAAMKNEIHEQSSRTSVYIWQLF
ncbi:unnamed protein product [Adineta ricciae]|uniref:Uncharacterized protein n=1 Tax=Adineta ricciae TaxID=249248 RepID=A0A815A279_ADIRI|nr:unnamed protein product [Adineta ricciae]